MFVDYEEQPVRIQVIDVNDEIPEFKNVPRPFLTTVSANAPPGTSVYQLMAQDADKGSIVRYILESGQSSFFRTTLYIYWLRRICCGSVSVCPSDGVSIKIRNSDETAKYRITQTTPSYTPIFAQYFAMSQKWCIIQMYLLWKANRNLCVLYQMVLCCLQLPWVTYYCPSTLCLGRIACTQCIRYGLLLQMSHIVWSVCLSVGHTDVLCRNGWTNRDAVGGWLLWL